MKLYLSSYGLGNEPEKLLELLGDGRRAAVIANALDYQDQDARATRLARELEALEKLGLEASELDLREFFAKPRDLASALAGYDLVWLRGGNAFMLRKAMQRSGFDETIMPFLQNRQLVYGGYSAGSVVAGPTLEGVELVDDVQAEASGYEGDPIWRGLGLIDYTTIPHYQSDHPESEHVDRTVAYYQGHNLPYKTLRDGQAIVIDGASETLAG
jgi:dipeptidase E